MVLFKGKEFLSNRDEQLFGFDFLTELVHQINEAVMQKNGVLLLETDQRMDGLLEILRKRQYFVKHLKGLNKDLFEELTS